MELEWILKMHLHEIVDDVTRFPTWSAGYRGAQTAQNLVWKTADGKGYTGKGRYEDGPERFPAILLSPDSSSKDWPSTPRGKESPATMTTPAHDESSSADT